MFCRNCGKDLVGTPEICASCGSPPVKATAFCRYCGGATIAQEVMCPQCGAATRTFAKSGEASNREGRGRFATTRTVFKILAAVTFVSVYTVLALPPRTALRPLQSATSDLVVATVGYSSLPLDSISASPFGIPRLALATGARNIIGEAITVIFAINATQQLTIDALYKNTTTNNATGTARFEDVTTKCTYQSSNEKIATVTSGGLVQGVAAGAANITVTYTAAPGSSDLSTAAAGKIPKTVSVTVPVVVGVTFTVR